VGLHDQQYFVPCELGMGLAEGYDNMGFNMSKPYLRAELEADLKRYDKALYFLKVKFITKQLHE
jgi:hypothetical protein